MRLVRTVAELRAALRPLRREGRTIGLVPTMGYLHDGHLSLVRRARAESDVVVVSLFVNPAQFGPGEDLERLSARRARATRPSPRPRARTCSSRHPTEEVYPEGFATSVTVSGLTEVMCGDPCPARPEHFDGVTTVVTKLLNIAQPDVAYFGQKDAQQALVIRRAGARPRHPGAGRGLPDCARGRRAGDSARATPTSIPERERATALSRALRAAEARVGAGVVDAQEVLRAARAELDGAGVEPEYLELRSAADLSRSTA